MRLSKSNKFSLFRFFWYFIGLILFFAPFAVYSRILGKLINVNPSIDIHSNCLRVPLQNLLTGKGLQLISIASISVVLLFIVTFLFGTIYCGRLCVAGALPEYISRLVPEKFKIDWYKYINPIPIRYGFLVGFLATPFLAGSIVCAFCNLSFLQRLMNGGFWGDFKFLGSTAIITGFIWLIVFGVFTKGGRGYCNFMCPVGAIQSLIHGISSRLGFTFKMKFSQGKCVSCLACVKTCPMGALKEQDKKLSYQIFNCINCRQCENTCPKSAISYGTGKCGWEKENIKNSKTHIHAEEVSK